MHKSVANLVQVYYWDLANKLKRVCLVFKMRYNKKLYCNFPKD